MNKQLCIAAGFTCVALTLLGSGIWMRHVSAAAKPPYAPPATSLKASLEPVLPEEASLKSLALDLVSEDPTKRQDAQKRLAEVPYERRGELRLIAEKALIPEARDLLNRRLAEMDAYLALNPLPISLHVKNAPLDEVASRLSAAMSVDLASERGPASVYTLDMDNKPFWEIIAALNAQYPLKMLGAGGQFHLNHWIPEPQAPPDIHGPFMAMGYAKAKPYAMAYYFYADPRMLALSDQRRVALIVDGHEVENVRGRPPRSPPPDVLSEPHAMEGSYDVGTVNLDPFLGKNLNAPFNLVKLHVRFNVAISTADLEIPDAQASVQKPFTVGNTVITLVRMNLKSPQTDPQGAQSAAGMNFYLTARTNGKPETVACTLLDGAGQPCFTTNFVGQGYGDINQPVRGPFTFRLKVPTEMKFCDVDFELKVPKNLPDVQPLP